MEVARSFVSEWRKDEALSESTLLMKRSSAQRSSVEIGEKM